MEYYDLTSMTWEEVKNSLETVQLAIIPIGAHEQHGPHMVESCDAVLAERMAQKLGRKCTHIQSSLQRLIWAFQTSSSFSGYYRTETRNVTGCDKRYDYVITITWN